MEHRVGMVIEKSYEKRPDQKDRKTKKMGEEVKKGDNKKDGNEQK